MLGSAHEVQRFHRYERFTCSMAVASVIWLGVTSPVLSVMFQSHTFTLKMSLKHYFLIRVLRDADETKEWIEEKNQALNTDNYGHDLASVQALQRKHEGFERDLAALGDKVFSSLLHSSFAFFGILKFLLVSSSLPRSTLWGRRLSV